VKTSRFTLIDERNNDAAEDARHFVEDGELGSGGMAVVKRVFDPRMLRHTALKALRPSMDEEQISRFIDEAQITGQLEHPGIVPVHEFGIDSVGELYLNMKLVQGETLRDIIDRAGPRRLDPIQLGRVLEILLKVSDALSYAHSRGVVHRDIKPSNIMVGEFGQVYLLDWGVALVQGKQADAVSLTRPSPRPDDLEHVIGTPAFMAPEQARSLEIDERTDIFGLGGLLYYALTGTPTYGDAGIPAALFKAISGEIEPIPEALNGHSVPRSLTRIAMQALSYDKKDRFQSTAEFRSALAQFLRGTWHIPTAAYSDGEIIFAEGTPGTSAYVIQRGGCRVFTTHRNGDKKVLRTLQTGDVFGETSIFTDRPRSASVEAIGDTELLMVTRDVLTDGLGLHSWMGRFVTALAHRFRDVDERLRALEETRER